MGTQTEIALLQANVAALGRNVRAIEATATDTARLVRELLQRVKVLQGKQPEALMRLDEVGRRLGLQRRTVERDIRRGLLKPMNIAANGRRPSWRVTEEQFAEYLRARGSTGQLAT